MQNAIRAYTHQVIDRDWPEMAREQFQGMDDSLGPLVLWQIVTNYRPPDHPRQKAILDKSLDELSQLSESFGLRYLYCREDLPGVVWVVIYAGLLITVGFSYFFGHEAFRWQALMCAILSSLLGLTILAILELAHPYQGAVTVSDQPFRYALMRMDDMDKLGWTTVTTNRRLARSDSTNASPREQVSVR